MRAPHPRGGSHYFTCTLGVAVLLVTQDLRMSARRIVEHLAFSECDPTDREKNIADGMGSLSARRGHARRATEDARHSLDRAAPSETAGISERIAPDRHGT